MQKTQSSIFKEFHLKKSLHTMVTSSMWWMCLAAFTKLRNIGRHFSEVQSLITSLMNQQAVSLLWEQTLVTAKF